jgi:hypothetical protein
MEAVLALQEAQGPMGHLRNSSTSNSSISNSSTSRSSNNNNNNLSPLQSHLLCSSINMAAALAALRLTPTCSLPKLLHRGLQQLLFLHLHLLLLLLPQPPQLRRAQQRPLRA